MTYLYIIILKNTEQVYYSKKAYFVYRTNIGVYCTTLLVGPITADAIASQLVRNGRYEAVDHKLSQLVSQKVSDLWRVTTPNPVYISETFSQRQFTAAQ